MPRASAVAKKATPTASTQKDKAKQSLDKYEFYDDNQEEAGGSNREDEAPSAVKISKKRFYEEVEEDDEETCSLPQPNTNFDGEMQSMLESFGADVKKSLVSKKKRLENFTQQSLKSANTKVEKIWKMQQTERNRLQDEYSKQLGSVLDQWETDVNKVKDQEEKIQALFRQQQKLFQQSRITMSQRLKTIRQLFEKYSKTMSDLEQSHTDQQVNVQGELRKEMAMLQKKILMDTQTQEMANVRKSLHSMFF